MVRGFDRDLKATPGGKFQNSNSHPALFQPTQRSPALVEQDQQSDAHHEDQPAKRQDHKTEQDGEQRHERVVLGSDAAKLLSLTVAANLVVKKHMVELREMIHQLSTGQFLKGQTILDTLAFLVVGVCCLAAVGISFHYASDRWILQCAPPLTLPPPATQAASNPRPSARMSHRGGGVSRHGSVVGRRSTQRRATSQQIDRERPRARGWHQDFFLRAPATRERDAPRSYGSV